MFLTYWLTWLNDQSLRPILLLGAVFVFVYLYITVQRIWRLADESRLGRLQEQLHLYAAAEYALHRSDHFNSNASMNTELAEELTHTLVACQTTPYITPDLKLQISAYLRDQEHARLPRLLRSINRESNKLTQEKTKLLCALEQPGWGILFWKQLRPALPAMMLAAGLMLLASLIRSLQQLYQNVDGIGPNNVFSWDMICIWSGFVSGIISLFMVGQVLLTNRRPSTGGVIMRVMATCIAILFLAQIPGAQVAPYVLAGQLLLYLLGFMWTSGKPRKTRPFVGNYELMDEDQLSTADHKNPQEQK